MFQHILQFIGHISTCFVQFINFYANVYTADVEWDADSYRNFDKIQDSSTEIIGSCSSQREHPNFVQVKGHSFPQNRGQENPLNKLH